MCCRFVFLKGGAAVLVTIAFAVVRLPPLLLAPWHVMLVLLSLLRPFAAAVTSVATTVPRDRPGGASCRTPWSRRRHRGPQASLCPPVFAETSANRLADVFACLCGQYQ